MSASNDLLVSTTEDLLDDQLGNLFFEGHPVLDHVFDKLTMTRTAGEYTAFDVLTDGPGDATQIVHGTEAYSYGNRDILKQGRVYVPEIVYAYQVTGKDLRRTQGGGNAAFINLIKKYPEAAMLHLRQEFARQFITGASNLNGLGGIVTMNGLNTYSPDGTALQGVLDFQARTAQTDTVFNLPKEAAANGVVGWYNQYGTVASFSAEGRQVMFQVYNEAKIRGYQTGGPRIGLTDGESFKNFYTSLDDQVRYTKGEVVGQKGKEARGGIPFHDMVFYAEPLIDDGMATAFAGKNGVMIGIDPETWHCLRVGEDSNEDNPTKGIFSARSQGQLPGRDAFGHELVLALQPYCNFLKSNFVIEGTRNA